MADLTICVMLPPRGDTTFDRTAHAKEPVLSVCSVYDLPPKAQITDPVHGFIRVTGCPEQVTARRLAERLCRPWEEEVFAGQERVVNYRAKRLWYGVVSNLTLRQRADLLRDRQTTMTWDEFRDAFVRQDTGETVRQELIARALG